MVAPNTNRSRVPGFGLLWVVAALLVVALFSGRLSISPERSCISFSGRPMPPARHWTPFDLSFDQLVYARDLMNIQGLPSMVSPERRLLTAHLAIGALAMGVPGDFVECGIAQGGTSILMHKVLEKYDASGRRLLWAADSFQGLPEPVDEDRIGNLVVGAKGQYSFGMDVVEKNFAKFQVSKERVRFLPGWFNESLPGSPIREISFLRLDGDLFVSTMDPLEALYDRVSVGGLIYVDDYGSYNGCREAVDKFRAERHISGPLYRQNEADSIGPRQFEAAWWLKSE